MLRKSYLFALVFFIAIAMNYSAMAQPTVSFESITDAFAYTGDNNAVTKVIITGEIEGERLTSDSEWYKFRSLNEAFPNIEEVEILTSQDLPESTAGNLFPDQKHEEEAWLKRFSAPNVKRIGHNTFWWCSKLTSVNFPSAIIIEDDAFYDCPALTEVTFPVVDSIGSTAFGYCANLTSINFPLLTKAGGIAFASCKKLKYVSMPSLIHISDAMFADCESLTNIDLPQVTTIGSRAFEFCDNLLSVNIPLATSIGYRAFGNCHNLSSVDFPLATSVEYGAFQECTILESANIPLTTSIGDRTFGNCHNLSSVDFPLVTSLGKAAFSGCFSLTTANMPLIKNIEFEAFRDCNSLASIDFPLVTSIKKLAFSGCANLTTINFPLVTEVGYGAFGGCKNLTTASFGTGFTADTRIEFGSDVFPAISSATPENRWPPYHYVTENMDLTLGDYVLPKPDMEEMRWQCPFGTDCKNGHSEEGSPDPYNYNYLWKSINGQLPGKTTDISEAANIQLTISPNPTSSSATLSFDLKEASNLNITLVDINSNEIMQLHNNFEQSGLFTKTFSIANLPVGVYFVKIALNEKNVKMEKIVKY